MEGKLARSHLTTLNKGTKSAIQCEYRDTIEGSKVELSVGQLKNSRTHIEAAEGVERPVLKIDLFFPMSHQLGANSENMTLKSRTNKKNKKNCVNLCRFYLSTYSSLMLSFFFLSDWLLSLFSHMHSILENKYTHKSHYKQDVQHQAVP